MRCLWERVQSFDSVAFMILALNKRKHSAYNKNEQSYYETEKFLNNSLSSPSPPSFCRAPCVFGEASGKNWVLYFLCQPAADIHLPATWGGDEDQHRAHSGRYSAAPPLQDLCHSMLGCHTSQSGMGCSPSSQCISSQMCKPPPASQDIGISLVQGYSESECKPQSSLPVLLVQSLWNSQIFLQGS